jgi:hypothetical protein
MYLVDLLKNIDQDITISDDAKLYIEKILIKICNLLFDKIAIMSTSRRNDKPINQHAVRLAVRMVFTGEIQNILLSEIDRAIYEGKHSLLFPTGFFTANHKMTSKGIIAITAVMEYVAYDILGTACISVIRSDRLRVLSNDIYDAIWSDAEIAYICSSNSIYLIRKQAPILPKHHIEQFIHQTSPSLRCNKDVMTSLSSYIEEYIGSLVNQQHLLPIEKK